MINPYSYPPGIVAIMIFCLGGLVLIKSPSALPGRVFIFMCISIFIWLMGYAIVFSTHDKDKALFFSKFLYLGVIMIPVALHHFCVLLLEENNLKEKRAVKISYLLGIGLVILTFMGVIIDGVRQFFWGLYPKAANLYFLFVIFFMFFYMRGQRLLSRALRSKTLFQEYSAHRIQQIRYLNIAMIIGVIASIDIIAKYGIPIYPIGYLFILIFIGVLAYAMIAHQLLDIQIIVRKTLIYSILTISISVFYITIVFGTQYFLTPKFVTYKFFASGLVIILVISLILKPLELYIRRILDHYFFHGTISEISKQKERLETELERRERLKSVGILAAGMAHEIKNPLTAIQTFADYLPKKYEDPEFRDKFQRIVTEEVGRIKGIVQNLLLFSKPQEPNPRPVQITSIIKNVLELLSSEFLRYKIRIVHNLDSSSPSVLVDSEQMKQAFLNIILNAIDAMKEKGGELKVLTTVTSKTLEISVKDQGPGIPQDKLPHIFDPFYSDKEGGTGLGLAIVHSIVEKNKGKVVVQSRPGQGAEFVVKLPI